MKVVVTISRKIKMNIDSPALEKLDKAYRDDGWGAFARLDESLQKKAIADVEEATGVPFASLEAERKPSGTVYFVNAEDGETILDW